MGFDIYKLQDVLPGNNTFQGSGYHGTSLDYTLSRPELQNSVLRILSSEEMKML